MRSELTNCYFITTLWHQIPIYVYYYTNIVYSYYIPHLSCDETALVNRYQENSLTTNCPIKYIICIAYYFDGLK